MKSVAACVVSLALALPVLAQPEQNRPQGAQVPQQPQPPQPAVQGAQRAPQPPALPAEVAPPQPPTPAMLEAQRRRDERSVDLDELLNRVARATGKRFIVDPRVRARVYGVPSIDTPTYAELLAILRMHGYAASEIGGRVNILPDTNARFMPVRMLQSDDPSVPDDEFVTRILRVPNAPQLVPILRPLMPQAAHLAALPGEEGEPGKLILMDTYASVRRMTELINELVR